MSLVFVGSQNLAINDGSDLTSLWNGSNVWSAPVATGVNATSVGLVNTTVVTSFAGNDLTQLLGNISSANVTDYVTFVFSGGPRRDGATVTGLLGREVYEFSSSPANFALSVTPGAIPEPSTSAAIAGCVVLACAAWRRRQRTSVALV